jgi:hypothetical protein
MIYFQNLNSNDLVTNEGRHVSKITPDADKHSKEITHYRLSVLTSEGDFEIRKLLICRFSIVIPDGCPALRRVEFRDPDGAPWVPDLRPG